MLDTRELKAHCRFERDKAYLALTDKRGRHIVVLRDEDVWEAIEEGYLARPTHDKDWKPCLIEYARQQALI